MKIVDGKPVDGAGVPHHPWCNDFHDSVSAPCGFCARLRADYPEAGKTSDELMAEHFPNNVRVG